MITIIKHKNITWINLESPNAEEVSKLSENYSIHPLIQEELISPTLRPKVDVYKDNLYLILHFPTFNPTTQTISSCEVDFVIGRDFLITAHYGKLDPLEKFLEEVRGKGEIKEKYFQKHAGFLVFYIVKELYNFSLRQLDYIHLKIDKVENEIFEDKEKEMVKTISLLKRNILDFRRAIYPHKNVLFSFEKSGRDFFGKEFSHYLNVLTGEYSKVENLLESSRETIEALYETNESLLSIKTNEIMKVLTVMAFITFPLMLLSSLFGMNTDFTPIVGLRGDFWIILGIMSSATVAMFVYFKKKKWL